MAYLLGVIVLVVGVLVSIGLHEIGHMVPAKRFGVRVSQYMVGFGPTLWSRTKGETEYGLKAIPLGGYVRLVGMYPTAQAVGDPPQRTVFGKIAAQAREASAEEILPGEDHRAFYRLSTPKKVIVMLGGPFMNLLIAIVLLTVVISGFGVAGSSTTLSAVSQCVVPAGSDASRECTDADELAPGAAAGLEPGDRVVSYDGVEVTSWEQLSSLIQQTGDTPVPVVVERDGDEVATTVTPIVAERPVYENGVAKTTADGEPVTHEVGFLGISPGTELQTQPISTVPGVVGDAVAQTLGVVVTLPARVVDVAQSAFGSAERDESTIISVVGVGRFAGEIASAEAEGYGLTERVASMLTLLASLNIALFAFNLIPLLPLDGGHVVGALWEGVRRQIARLRGRARPGPFDTARLVPLAYGVFVLLAGMGALLIYADVVKPVTLG